MDPALAGLRDKQALAGIPEPERRSLRDLWRRIDALRAKAAAPPRKDTARAEIREGGCNVGGLFPNLVIGGRGPTIAYTPGPGRAGHVVIGFSAEHR